GKTTARIVTSPPDPMITDGDERRESYSPSVRRHPKVPRAPREDQMPTATAAQRRDEARLAYNAFVAACPTRQLLDTLSDKWVCLILSALVDGPRRHSDLARTIA